TTAQDAETQASVQPPSAAKEADATQELDPAAQKKARIGAAVAKAKAKKLAKEGLPEAGEDTNKNVTPEAPEVEAPSAKQRSNVVKASAASQAAAPSDAEQALDEKKRRIAAAVAKAKAKKAAQMKSSEE
ncbi:MAG: electron transport complex subunit RsxC, partial [Paraglaciecola chathamensis]